MANTENTNLMQINMLSNNNEEFISSLFAPNEEESKLGFEDSAKEFQKPIKFITNKCDPGINSFLQKKKTLKQKTPEGEDTSNGRWTQEEQKKFAEAVLLFSNDWKSIQAHVNTRCGTQIRSHAQKFLMRLKENKFLISKGLQAHLSWTKAITYLRSVLTYDEMKDALDSVELGMKKKDKDSKIFKKKNTLNDKKVLGKISLKEKKSEHLKNLKKIKHKKLDKKKKLLIQLQLSEEDSVKKEPNQHKQSIDLDEESESLSNNISNSKQIQNKITQEDNTKSPKSNKNSQISKSTQVDDDEIHEYTNLPSVAANVYCIFSRDFRPRRFSLDSEMDFNPSKRYQKEQMNAKKEIEILQKFMESFNTVPKENQKDVTIFEEDENDKELFGGFPL